MSSKDIKVNDLVTINEAAAIIGVHETRVQKLVRDDRFDGVVKFGPRQTLIPIKSVEYYRDNRSAVGRPRTKKPVSPRNIARPQ